MKQIKLNRSSIHLGDCLQLMHSIPDKSIDMVLADLPYGTTACKWDSIICTNCLWNSYNRIIKDNGAIVLTASQPFTTTLINSNIKYFRYSVVWDKKQSGNPLLAKRQFLKVHEDIVIFYKKQCTYNPIMVTRGKPRSKGTLTVSNKDSILGEVNLDTRAYNNTYYPKSILIFSNAYKINKVHPTQKPVKLFQYLIKTYTNKNEIVLDNTAGSFTTSIACINTDRRFICIEKEEEYFTLGYHRIYNHIQDLNKKYKFKIYT